MTGRTAAIAESQERLLERSGQLHELDELWAAVASGGGGRLAFVRGEAGAGKSALVRRFCEERPRVLWGACDALFAPRPLGPFVDIAREAGGQLEARVEAGGRPYEVLEALRAELERGRTPVVVIEDIHWADEGTLDVLRLLGRRIENVRALVIATLRDDALGRAHPLQIVVGELATARGIARVRLPPLSVRAVADLAEPFGADSAVLHRTTGGNPFFVVEALRAGGAEIPETIREAVLARVARLGAPAQMLLEALAVLGTRARLDVLQAVAGDAMAALDECLASGVLVPAPEGVAFRHELVAGVVAESLSPHRRSELHARSLDVLEREPHPDLARLVHHAVAVGDREAVLRHAPRAAAAASALGAHRESAALYALALDAGPALVRRAEFQEARASECAAVDDTEAAIAALGDAIPIRRELGDARAAGRDLLLLSEVLWCPGRVSESDRAARRAVEVLERAGPGKELAMAHLRLSELCAYAGDLAGTLRWGERVLSEARELGADELALDARTNIALARALARDRQALEQLAQCFAEAREAGLDELAGRAVVDLVWVHKQERDIEAARRFLEVGLEYVGARGLERWRCYLLCHRAQLDLAAGRWDEAAQNAEAVLREGRASSIPRVAAGVVIGLVRARRGDPDVWPVLDDALALAEASEGLGSELVALARAEASWLTGDRAGVESATSAQLVHQPWVAAELAAWRRRMGISATAPAAGLPGPYGLELAGDPLGAAAAWRELGCPYEAALAVLGSGDADALRRAHEELVALGARPAAAIVARRLRELGERVPAGPRARTRENPAGMTARELEVLALLVEGLRNTEIADRLVVSPKTVDHHVSAILRKLDVRTRGQAATAAVQRNLLAPG